MEKEKLHVPYPVIVEGKYDKIRLSGVIDGVILTTAGFGVFNHKEKLALIRKLSEPGGVIVLTDSDGAGKVIRSHITSALPKEKVHHLYIPQIKGKEKRKSAPSKEGTLGVEGMDDSLLRDLFLPFAADAPVAIARGGITKADLFALSLTGADGAADRRDRLCARLGLPLGMTPNALLDAVNILYSKDSFMELAANDLAQEDTQ